MCISGLVYTLVLNGIMGKIRSFACMFLTWRLSIMANPGLQFYFLLSSGFPYLLLFLSRASILFQVYPEGKVYNFIFFSLIPNTGLYHASFHEFKILFNVRARVVPDESKLIPMNGLYLKNSAKLELTVGECDFFFISNGYIIARGGVYVLLMWLYLIHSVHTAL